MVDIVDSYELSPLQQGMLFHALSTSGSGVDIEQIFFALDERLDVAMFVQAMREVMARYPVMRTRLRWKDVGEPCQEVLAQPEMPTTVADWSDVPLEVAQRRFDAYVRADRHRDFDLSRAPTMRLFIARFPGERSRVLYTFHHVIGDGRSFIALREWLMFYDAAKNGEVLSLPPARPFRDYIAWHRSLDSTAAEQFWCARLADFDTPTPLGADAPSRPATDEKFESIEHRFSRSVSDGLRDAAELAGVTVNTLVQAGWAVLLHRYSGESDVVFGTTRVGRSGLDGADRIVGPLFNTLPLRAKVDDDAAIVPWLQSLRAEQIAVRPFEHAALATVQACSGITRGNKLFESILVYDHKTLDTLLRTPGRRFHYVGQTNFPLTLRAWGDAGDGEMLLRLEYSTQRFAEVVITRMLRHLANVLTGLADPHCTRIGDLGLLNPGERIDLVGAGPIPAVVTSDETLHAGFARQVAANPDAIALSAQTPTGRMELSYAELDARAEAIASHLRELGIGAGQVVGLRAERSPDVVIGILAILKAGAAYLPMDPLYPTDRIAFMLADAAVRVVLTQHTFLDELHTLPVHTVCLDQPLPPVTTPTPAPAQATSADLAYVMYTSGSTGNPKGVRVTHHNVLRLFAATIPHFGFGPDDVWTLWHSYSFDISVSELWGALLTGARLVIVTQDTSRDPAAFRALVEREHVTVMSQTPTGFQAFIDIDHTTPPADFTLRYILLCGEALHLQSLQPWFDRYGDRTPQIINMYGPTEATLYVTHQRITQADLDAGAGSIIGTPLPDIRIYLLDPRGEPVPTGVAGELYIAGAGVAAGYLNRPDLNTERFLPDPFHGGPMYRTGDLARRLQHGELEYLGRIDQQVKIRGFRIELGEIETTIAAHPAVHQVAVIDHENAPGDKELIAYLVAPTAGPTLITDLRQTLREHLPEYMIPAHFHHLDELPLTTSGKLDRKALPTPTHQRNHTTTAYTAPRNPAEQTIADIWKAVLRIDKVGLDDHFFELGGDSLLSIRVHTQLTSRLHANLPIIALLQYPTVRTLARHITGHHNHNTTEATMTRARKQREALAHHRELTERR
ncbi:amino acid adenylation domain-containing protein [Mycobacterium sp. AMU20-3851]|uniref:non-ribosomal peptide synthetase n=1 Tax=Mycobacterium sp. AMU20-3851 TaxID=3122055 RepID=UPI0037546993